MISIEQIKAGRALMDWTQADLAKAAGLSKPSVNTLERRIARPKLATLESIRKALEKAGVEFTEGPGVRLRGAVLKTQVFEGEDSLLRLMHDIFATLEGTGNEVMISGIEEKKYRSLGGTKIVREIEKHRRRGIKSRLLCLEGDTDFIEPASHYRWMPARFFSRTPTYVYGDKYAILLWGPPKKVVLIENAEVAECYRRQFLAFWEVAKQPPAR
jgi:transcriptional regulator with XRE-family HTH domain